MSAGTAVSTPIDGTLERLEASSLRLAALDQERRVEASRRNALVIEARDFGASWRTIARRAKCSISRCVAIVGGG